MRVEKRAHIFSGRLANHERRALSPRKLQEVRFDTTHGPVGARRGGGRLPLCTECRDALRRNRIAILLTATGLLVSVGVMHLPRPKAMLLNTLLSTLLKLLRSRRNVDKNCH